LENSRISGKQLREKAQAQSGIANANLFRILSKSLTGKNLEKKERKSRAASKAPKLKLRSISRHDPRRLPFVLGGTRSIELCADRNQAEWPNQKARSPLPLAGRLTVRRPAGCWRLPLKLVDSKKSRRVFVVEKHSQCIPEPLNILFLIP
jgi:hypothetical protein